MDGDNQRVVIDAFFESVMPQESLVFMYLKHSPGRRAARFRASRALASKFEKPN